MIAFALKTINSQELPFVRPIFSDEGVCVGGVKQEQPHLFTSEVEADKVKKSLLKCQMPLASEVGKIHFEMETA